MFCALISGVPTVIAVMAAASFLLITRRVKPERVFSEIDWSLLVFFCGLFVVTKAIETIRVSDLLINILQINSGNEVFDLTILSTISSNLISNVPAVLLLKNIVQSYSNIKLAWLTMAMATTLAGNLTLLGSVANLIVAESARKRGVILSFAEYLRVGILITTTTLFLGALWLSLFYY
jgi:Na+/H+ antiporter NhaD/arsenite permease-like protein